MHGKRTIDITKGARSSEILERIVLFAASARLSASCTPSSSPMSTSMTLVERYVALDLFALGDLGDLGHEIVGHMLHVRLYPSRIERCIVAQVRKVERVGCEMGL